MNKLWLLLIFFLFGFTPLYDDYENFEQVTDEIKNMEVLVQDKQFEIVNATPTLRELQDGQIVIVSSNGWVQIMFRENEEIYAIDVSCVTVKRGE